MPKIKPEDRKIRFGIHKGKKFKEVPTSYLEWLCDNIFSTKKNSIYPQLELERRAKEGMLVIHTRGQLKTKFARELIMDIIERHDEKENL